ncbi:MAG: IS1 family transposase [Deltaproteobacteria bacterium]|nr:MAG: IS1 family transposase [Deltaproteobacteria bacterium]
MKNPLQCPVCNCNNNIIKNGSNSSGKQKYRCKDCGVQFVENPENRIISKSAKDMTEDLLPEKIPLAGIVRVAKVSKRWLQNYANNKYENIVQAVNVSEQKKGKLTIECDEMWSFVEMKSNKQWIWLAKNIETKEIAGVYVGSRDKEGDQGLWDSLPGVYRQCAVSHTDFRAAYKEIFPACRHIQVEKGSGNTNSTENFNCIMRQRISRIVRKTLSFSKKLTNHIGAIWNFIHHYNASSNIQ